MEALSDALQDYKELVGTVAGIVTIGQMFSGFFICFDIFKQKNSKGIPITPFLGGFILSILNLKYGFLLRDATMINVNFVGLALNIIYLMIFFNYAQDKGQVWFKMGLGTAFAASIIGYTQVEDPLNVEYRFGLILTALMFTLIASPLFDLGNIIKNQSTEGMPFPMIFSGAIVTFMWLLYGIIIKNQFIVIQNVVGVTLCAIQLSLFVIYPSKPKAKSSSGKSKAKKVD